MEAQILCLLLRPRGRRNTGIVFFRSVLRRCRGSPVKRTEKPMKDCPEEFCAMEPAASRKVDRHDPPPETGIPWPSPAEPGPG